MTEAVVSANCRAMYLLETTFLRLYSVLPFQIDGFVPLTSLGNGCECLIVILGVFGIRPNQFVRAPNRTVRSAQNSVYLIGCVRSRV